MWAIAHRMLQSVIADERSVHDLPMVDTVGVRRWGWWPRPTALEGVAEMPSLRDLPGQKQRLVGIQARMQIAFVVAFVHRQPFMRDPVVQRLLRTNVEPLHDALGGPEMLHSVTLSVCEIGTSVDLPAI